MKHRHLEGRRVAVLDDDRGLLEMLSLALADVGCQVEAHAEPEAFLATVARRRPEILLVDLGVFCARLEAALARIRAAPGLGQLPVIVMSADPAAPAEARARGCAAAGFIAKPFDIDELYALLARALAGASPPPA